MIKTIVLFCFPFKIVRDDFKDFPIQIRQISADGIVETRGSLSNTIKKCTMNNRTTLKLKHLKADRWNFAYDVNK